MFKRSVTYQGLNCLSDMEDPLYIELGALSQTQQPWMDNLLYCNYLLYFGAGLIFLFLLKYGWYNLIDGGYDSDLTTYQFLLWRKAEFSEEKKSNKEIDYSTTTNYRPSIIPRFTSILRQFSYKRLPALFGKFGLPRMNYGIVFVLILVTIFTLAFSFTPRPYYRQCRGFGSPPLAVRTGLMAMGTMLFIYFLSGKTNLISWCTGIGYEKLYVYHKYVSWVCCFLSFLHTVPFIYQAVREGGYDNWRTTYVEEYELYVSGFVALAAIFWLCFGSLSIIRDLSHEVFLQLHWIVACLFFVSMVVHIANAMDAWKYMWALVVIWVAQLMYRAGVKTFLKPNKWFMKPRVAKITLLDEATFTLNIVNSGLDWEVGQHIFIRYVGKSLLQNHPFTIANIPTSYDSGENSIKLIVKSRNGLTKRVQAELAKATELSVTQEVYVDGPYGTLSRDVDKFDNVIQIANGSGVTFTLPFLMRSARSIAQCDFVAGYDNAKQSVVKKSTFIWIIRHIDAIDWICKELEECALAGRDLISIDIYITSMKGYEGRDAERYSLFNITFGKPDARKLLNEMSGSQLLRRNIVLCSGTAGLTCDVSNGVADIQTRVRAKKSHVEEVYLHTENFEF